MKGKIVSLTEGYTEFGELTFEVIIQLKEKPNLKLGDCEIKNE